jgi:hypothetical protein
MGATVDCLQELLTCECVLPHMAHDKLHKVWLLHAHQLGHLLGHPCTNVAEAALPHELPTHGEAAKQPQQTQCISSNGTRSQWQLW